MITLKTKPKMSLHEAVIESAKQIYGDVPVQIPGECENITVTVDTNDDTAEKHEQLQTSIATIFESRGIGVDVVEDVTS